MNRDGKEYRIRRRRFRWETAVAIIEAHHREMITTMEKIAVIERAMRATHEE